jgi:hypothetical protein
VASRNAIWLAVLLTLLAVPNGLVQAADELLENGGFEQSGAGWKASGVSFSGCPARGGNRAAAFLLDEGGSLALLEQTIAPAGVGSYSLSGYLMRLLGAADVRVSLIWRNAQGGTIAENKLTPVLQDTYTAFTVTNAASSPDAKSVLVRIRVSAAAAATVCLDDLSLSGPPAPEPTSTAIPTATPTPTPAPPATATREPTATRVPTNTPSPSEETSNDESEPADEGEPTATATGSLVNGDFENGIAGWQKYGGELRAVASPVHGGGGAGAMVSGTTSTKWAFQVVSIDSGQVYEFAGYLQADAGVKEAYLRISWYGSSDGSGRALATVDSLTKVSGPSDGYVFLTTGPVRPPPGARSAKPRALLAPLSGAPATMYLDDFVFSVAAPGSEPPRTATAAPDAGEAAADTDQAPPSAVRAAAGATPSASPRPSQTPQSTQVPAAIEGAAEDAERDNAGGTPGWVWFLGGVLFILGPVTGYVLAKRLP